MAIVIHSIKGKPYAYEHKREGKKVITKYIGPVDDQATKNNYLEKARPAEHGGGRKALTPEEKTKKQAPALFPYQYRDVTFYIDKEKKIITFIWNREAETIKAYAKNHPLPAQYPLNGISGVLMTDTEDQIKDKVERELKRIYENIDAETPIRPPDIKDFIIDPDIKPKINRVALDAVNKELAVRSQYAAYDIDAKSIQYTIKKYIYDKQLIQVKPEHYKEFARPGSLIFRQWEILISQFAEGAQNYAFIENNLMQDGKKKPKENIKKSSPGPKGQGVKQQDPGKQDRFYYASYSRPLGSWFKPGQPFKIEEIKPEHYDFRYSREPHTVISTEAPLYEKIISDYELIDLQASRELKKLIEHVEAIKWLRAEMKDQLKNAIVRGNFKTIEEIDKKIARFAPKPDALPDRNFKTLYSDLENHNLVRVSSFEKLALWEAGVSIKDCQHCNRVSLHDMNLDNAGRYICSVCAGDPSKYSGRVLTPEEFKAREAERVKQQDPGKKKASRKKKEPEKVDQKTHNAVVILRDAVKTHYRSKKVSIQAGKGENSDKIYVKYNRQEIKETEQEFFNLFSLTLYRYAKEYQVKAPALIVNNREFDKEGKEIKDLQAPEGMTRPEFMKFLLGDYKDAGSKSFFNIGSEDRDGNKIKVKVPKYRKLKSGTYYLAMVDNNISGMDENAAKAFKSYIEAYGLKMSIYTTPQDSKKHFYLLPQTF